MNALQEEDGSNCPEKRRGIRCKGSYISRLLQFFGKGKKELWPLSMESREQGKIYEEGQTRVDR